MKAVAKSAGTRKSVSGPTESSLPPLFPQAEYLAAAGALIDEELERFIRREEQVPGLHDGMLYAMGLDLPPEKRLGKRVRPVLCLLSARALGANERLALPFALAIELMHNFALVHDDIEDGDTMRRDRPSTHVRFGIAHGVNIGDYLLCKVLTALLGEREAGLGPERTLALIRLMSETLDHTHIGQALDIGARGKSQFTLEEYLRLVREKTGYYLAAPLLGGAIVAGANAEVLERLARLGHALGPLFQIRDDLIDLTRGKGRGGEIGSDIREGKRSFCVVHAAGQLAVRDRKRLFVILDKPRVKTTKSDIDWVLSQFAATGAVDAAQDACDEFQRKANDEIEHLPDPLRPALQEMVARLARRER